MTLAIQKDAIFIVEKNYILYHELFHQCPLNFTSAINMKNSEIPFGLLDTEQMFVYNFD